MINKQLRLNLAHLYPKSMNIYGDRGNVITLVKRCQWRNIDIHIDEIEVGEKYNPLEYDLVFSGGGQDIHQLRIAADLQQKKSVIIESIDRGTVFFIDLRHLPTFWSIFSYFNKSKNTWHWNIRHDNSCLQNQNWKNKKNDWKYRY